MTPPVIEPGTIADYHALARFHYRAGRPATVVRILRAVDFEAGTLAAVLVVSMPTIDAAWRNLAWPGRYNPRLLGRAAALRRVNGELRAISRVIVDPRFRALGLARRLVRAYLDAPLTPATEAVAAMGIACPFFARAGMTPYRLPPSRADARLLDALQHARTPVEDLADPDLAPSLCRNAFIARELRTWASWSKPARAVRGRPPCIIAPIAATCLLARPVAYAWSALTTPHPGTESPGMNPIPRPARPSRAADLPRPLTFFLTARDRAEILRTLRRSAPDRSTALLAALGLAPSRKGSTRETPHVQKPTP